jgi:DNA-binding NtrC family response regulator
MAAGPTKEGKILIVDDDEDILLAAKLLLKRHYRNVTTTCKPSEITALMASQHFDAILLDMNFSPGESSGQQGFKWLATILEIDPQAVVVLITAHGGVDVAVEAMKLGATDFISKPWQNEKLVATLSSAFSLSQSRSRSESLKMTNVALTEAMSASRQPMLGNSTAMQEVLSLIQRCAPTAANVLLLGENGTGKELAARAIHQQSQRSQEAFIGIDLGSISESLFESELFGHKKGAFTDAKSDRIGLVQAAQGGTLFLDEIGNLALHLQAKLLTVLEQRQVSPVGSNQRIDIDVRIIAATNTARENLVNESVFRQDLLFRLNTVEITLPPLRDRPEDIPDIVSHYARVYAHKYGKAEKSFSKNTMDELLRYRWPGNIRALRHSLERAVILSEGSQYELVDFQLDTTAGDSVRLEDGTGNSKDDDFLETNDLNLEQLEKKTIEKVLRKHRYNISHSAKTLGLTRAALYRRMEKYGF